MIKVLIVDDSKVIQEFLDHLLSTDCEIKVVGIASSGNEAIEMAKTKSPDVITMDIQMPWMDGYEATRTIMETHPTRIIIVSENAIEPQSKNRYQESGALAVVIRPAPFELLKYEAFQKELILSIKLMSEIKVVKLFPRSRKVLIPPNPIIKLTEDDKNRIRVIAIGASTGGPNVLQIILSKLPPDLSVPILIVQHIAPGFIQVFQKMLSSSSGIKLKIAQEGEKIMAGFGYIAPDNFHMGVTNDGKIILSNQPPENGSKPSVGFLFRSVANAFGPNALGVLLTGMGKDGADELKDMKNKGALTVVQNEESSVVFGMPGEALRIGASNTSLSPERIAKVLVESGLKNRL
ncbi:MAG: chemotaxis-specific protein-glutamate methyltransferase CheB [Salinivirgaceae bacterium]